MPEFLPLIRVTAAGLGSRLGFSYDEVEDLRLAIDELCIGLTGKSGRDGTVNVRFRVEGDALEVTAEGRFEDTIFIPPESPWSRMILEALVDEHELGPGPGGPRFRLVKRSAAPPRPPAPTPA